MLRTLHAGENEIAHNVDGVGTKESEESGNDTEDEGLLMLTVAFSKNQIGRRSIGGRHDFARRGHATEKQRGSNKADAELIPVGLMI